MTSDQFTAILAQRVMGWGVSPTRFLMGDRGWRPRWRFQPITKLADAVRLLEAADPQEYEIRAVRGGGCAVRIVIGGNIGQSSDTSSACAITFAVAQAVGIAYDPTELNAGKGERP